MKSITRASAILMAVTLLTGTAVAQSVGTTERSGETNPSFEATQIVFKPGVGKVGLTLSVSGPGDFQLKEDFGPGVSPTFSVSGLEDGLYSYEVWIAPTTSSEDTGAVGDKTAEVTPNERGLRDNARRHQDAVVQSGHFRIEAGILVLKNVVERGSEASLSELELTGQTGLAEKDVCHNDDLIVDGSLCVGLDCVCNMAFGFDTIVLRENNLRILFDDTSSTASFPNNDWSLIINDSSNGGGNYFGIEDRSGSRMVFSIEAGARANSLYVESSGEVGIGTSNPVADLHIKIGDTPTLRLEQDGSSGFTPQTWDVAGNETNFFIRDMTAGSRLPLRIRPGAPTSSIDVEGSGDVGFGTSSPAAALHTVRTSGPSAKTMLHLENNGGVRFDFEDTNAGGFWRFQTASSANELQITRSGTGVTELMLDNNGNLTVHGDINSGGTTFVPDYVFSPDYSLMSVYDLKAFITRERHLPGIPSATEIEQQGSVNLSKMQMRLLEKIEELTLYIVEQQKAIDELEARLAEIEN